MKWQKIAEQPYNNSKSEVGQVFIFLIFIGSRRNSDHWFWEAASEEKQSCLCSAAFLECDYEGSTQTGRLMVSGYIFICLYLYFKLQSLHFPPAKSVNWLEFVIYGYAAIQSSLSSSDLFSHGDLHCVTKRIWK